jgi:hypothetical protein
MATSEDCGILKLLVMTWEEQEGFRRPTTREFRASNLKGWSHGRRRGLRLNVHRHVLRALKGLSCGLHCGLRHAGQVHVAFLDEVRHQEGDEGAEEHLSTQSHVDMSGSKCGSQMGPATDDRSKLNKARSASTSADGGQ